MIRHLLASLRFYRRSHLGVLLGSMLAAAVLTGSLLVGDSVDGSLRKAALQRLGTIEAAMQTPNRFFASRIAEKNGAVPVLQLRGIALTDERQINRVQVLGVSSNVWKFASQHFQTLDNEVLLGRKLADALGAKVGDEISLRIEKPGLLPRDAPLSEQGADRTVRGRLKVARVLDDDELGRFSLSANQQAPYNAFVNIQWLEEITELDGTANLLVSDRSAALNEWDSEDFGFRFRTVEGITQLESDQIYLGSEAARAALSIPGAQGTLTYLVNSLSSAAGATPYSFVIAKDGLAEDEMIVNRWLADELNVSTGDLVEMNFFELLPGGGFEERSRTFRVGSIVSMDELALEKQLAPNFPGLSDVDRCADWDVGIPMDEAELENEANEAYWEQYGQTPKAIISLSAGQEMWSNRFGGLTSVRWRAVDAQAAFEKEYDPAAAGFVFQSVREQALAAVNQTLDFGQLFVGMSFFLIVAALILTALLFVFSAQQRAEEVGILLATGWRPRTVRNLLLAEGGLVALAGSIAGALIGIGYTQLLLSGLSNHWKGAVAGAAIELFVSAQTVSSGMASSLICAVLAMLLAIRKQTKQPARELLVADFQTLEARSIKSSNVWKIINGVSLPGAIAIVAYALTADLRSVTMPFFGAGALLLVSGILLCGTALNKVGGGYGLSGLALRNASRRKGRSLSVIALLACGSFLVFAVSSMEEDVAAHTSEPWSGTGGFEFFGESTLPITDNLGGVRVRVRDGDDASCLNLNRAQSPQLLGVAPDAMSTRHAFFEEEDIWARLKQKLPDGAVPALAGDADTLMWGLKKKVGDRLTFRDETGGTFEVELVGALPMRLSVFQGSLLIAEEIFTALFPAEEGWRMFLLNERVQNRRYERAGLDVIPAVERLLDFYAVESTYLAMFLVLGALGMVVGSIGMGVVVLRNVQDRRVELAVLHAVGYRTARLRGMLWVEHGILLAAGLTVGIVAAMVAMLPMLLRSGTNGSVWVLALLPAIVIGSGAACIWGAVQVALRGNVLRGLRDE